MGDSERSSELTRVYYKIFQLMDVETNKLPYFVFRKKNKKNKNQNKGASLKSPNRLFTLQRNKFPIARRRGRKSQGRLGKYTNAWGVDDWYSKTSKRFFPLSCKLGFP